MNDSKTGEADKSIAASEATGEGDSVSECDKYLGYIPHRFTILSNILLQ